MRGFHKTSSRFPNQLAKLICFWVIVKFTTPQNQRFRVSLGKEKFNVSLFIFINLENCPCFFSNISGTFCCFFKKVSFLFRKNSISTIFNEIFTKIQILNSFQPFIVTRYDLQADILVRGRKISCSRCCSENSLQFH